MQEPTKQVTIVEVVGETKRVTMVLGEMKLKSKKGLFKGAERHDTYAPLPTHPYHDLNSMGVLKDVCLKTKCLRSQKQGVERQLPSCAKAEPLLLSGTPIVAKGVILGNHVPERASADWWCPAQLGRIAQ
jgi:hypothetical protein